MAIKHILFTAVVALCGYSSAVQAQSHLGGVDLQRYCRETFGNNIRRVGHTAYDWRCGGRSISVNDACRRTYGYGARAKYGNFQDANSWYCYR